MDYLLCLTCLAGSIVFYFQLKNENRNPWRFMCYINSNWIDTPIANIVDLLLFALLGSVVGMVITQPTTYQQAFTAGIGWTGLISTSLPSTRRRKHHSDKSTTDSKSIKI